MPRTAKSTADPFDAKPANGKATKRRRSSAGKEAKAVAAMVDPTAKPAAPPVEPFATAPDQKGFPVPGDLKRGFETIVLDLFADGYDARVEWDAINEALTIDGSLTPGALQAAATRQEPTADRAFRLFTVAKRECNAYLRETEPIVGAIREAAIAHLEREKRTMVEDGKGKKVPLRSKQITEADVDASCAQHYPNEWSDVCDRRERAELMLKQIENLAGLARSRAFTVSNMLSPGRKTVG